MEMNNVVLKYFRAAFLLLVISTTGCADWRSKPDVVDEHFGDAVRTMVRNQTLNPQAGLIHEPVLSYDGQKGEGVIKAYRGGTVDLKKGKKELNLDVDSSR